MSFQLIFNALSLGVGLSMDAFCVSMTNGLNDPGMRGKKQAGIAFVYAFYQTVMPLIGWILVRTAAQTFTAFRKMIPWIALLLLLYIGGKMVLEAIRSKKENDVENAGKLTFRELQIQGIATSIDALSVGFTISEYVLHEALFTGLLIGLVTFVLCVAGVRVGRKAGDLLAGYANFFGGAILIAIGIEIFVNGTI